MKTENIRGRHRTPGRHNPLLELKLLARESAQPAMKGAAVVAATGGLLATFANPANADAGQPANDVVAAGAVDAPSVVGPSTVTSAATVTALSNIGFKADVQKAVQERTATKPKVIEDIVVKEARQKAAERKAAAERASRDLTRTTLTNSTSSTKSSSNSSVPGASSGTRSSYNWATQGQCTWGALNKWYQSEGYYPGGWTGNALVWDTGARAAGYTVTTTPRTRSIVVMEPGVHGASSAGHVAWVTAVNGNEVTIIEMNALAGPYNYNTRTVTNISGMHYIYAP
jgi:surface antigen